MGKTNKEIPVAEAAAEDTMGQVPLSEKEKDTEIAVFPATENVEENVTEKFDAEATEFFKEYPDASAFHFTSDGLAFFQQGDARNHANGLEDKTVITKIRK
jgi:hypothetical protein